MTLVVLAGQLAPGVGPVLQAEPGVIGQLNSIGDEDGSPDGLEPTPQDPATTYWRRISPVAEMQPELLIAPSDDRVLYARDRLTKRLWHSKDRGDTWRELKLSLDIEIGALLAVLPADQGRALAGLPPEVTWAVVAGAGAARGFLFRIRDTGAVEGLNEEPFQLARSAGETVLAPIVAVFVHPKAPARWLANITIGEKEARVGAILASDDAGKSWSVWRDGWQVLAVDPNDANVMFAQAARQSEWGYVVTPIEKTRDGGRSWQPIWSEVATNVLSVQFAPSDSQVVYLTRQHALGFPGAFRFDAYASSAGGEGEGRWGALSIPNSGPPRRLAQVTIDPKQPSGAVWTANGGDIWYQADQTGQGWPRSLSLGPSVAPQTSVYFDRAGDYLYAALADGGIFRRRFRRDYPAARLTNCESVPASANAPTTGWSFNTWRATAPSDPRYQYRFEYRFPDPLDNWSSSSLERSTDGGSTWTSIPIDFTGALPLAVDLWDPDRLYITAYYGVAGPVDAEKSSRFGYLYVSVAGARPVPTSAQPISSPFETPEAPTKLGAIYQFAARPDLMFVSTWNFVQVNYSPPGAYLYTDLFVSHDSGNSWTLWFQGGTDIVIDPVHSSTFYVSQQTDTGAFGRRPTRVHRTADDGATWSNVVDQPRRGVVIHPLTNHVFAGTLWSPDSGQTWWHSTPAPPAAPQSTPVNPYQLDPAVPNGLVTSSLNAWSPDGGVVWYPVARDHTAAAGWTFSRLDERGEFALGADNKTPPTTVRCRFERPKGVAPITRDGKLGPPQVRAAHLERFKLLPTPNAMPLDAGSTDAVALTWHLAGLNADVRELNAVAQDVLFASALGPDGAFHLYRREQDNGPWQEIPLPAKTFATKLPEGDKETIYAAATDGLHLGRIRWGEWPPTWRRIWLFAGLLDNPAWSRAVAPGVAWPLVGPASIVGADYDHVTIDIRTGSTGYERRQTYDGGATWRRLPIELAFGQMPLTYYYPPRVETTIPTRWWRASGQIDTSDDGGATWTSLGNLPSLAMRATFGYVVGGPGRATTADFWLARGDATGWRVVSAWANPSPKTEGRHSVPGGLVVVGGISNRLWLALNQSDPASGTQIVWLGQSDDGGATWRRLALPDTGSIQSVAYTRNPPTLHIASSKGVWSARVADR